jgi:auxin efflux carrier family protein
VGGRLLQIGAVFVWSIAYNIIRVTSKVEEGGGGHGNAQTNEPDVLSSGSGRGTVAEEKNSSTSNDCAHECTLPLLSNRIPAAKNKVCQC